MAVGPCAPRPGLHSSQSAEFIEEGNSCCVKTGALARHQVYDPSILRFFLSSSAAYHCHLSLRIMMIGVAKVMKVFGSDLQYDIGLVSQQSCH